MYAELVFEAVQVPAVAGWQAIVQKVEWVGSVRVGGDTQTETSGMKETYIHTHARTHARTRGDSPLRSRWSSKQRKSHAKPC